MHSFPLIIERLEVSLAELGAALFEMYAFLEENSDTAP